jgi:hypothetical protein
MNTHTTTRSVSVLGIRVVTGVIAVLALVGAACSNDSSGASTIDNVDVTAPAQGATVGESFSVDVDTSAPIGEPDTGRQHLHFYYDVEPGAEDYDIVYKLPFKTRQLSPGEHTIHVVVANADHSITDVRQDLTLMVEPGATGDGGDGGGGGSGGNGDGEPAPIPGY